MVKLEFCRYAVRKKGTEIPFHSHSINEIVYYGGESSGITIIGGKEYKFRKGNLAIIHSGCDHKEIHFSDGEVYFFGFESDIYAEAGMYENMWHVRPLFQNIISEAKNQEAGYESIISHKLSEILIYANREREHRTEVKDIMFCKRYIEENYMYKITVEELSEMSGYSYEHFRKLFTKTFSVSPQQYLIETRLNNAVRMLSQTKLSCTETAYRCGFSDSGQMTKLIKAKYNKTPTQIRCEGQNLEI